MLSEGAPRLHDRQSARSWRRLDELKPNPRDLRTCKRADHARVVRMVRRFGVIPMIVTAAGVVISGNS